MSGTAPLHKEGINDFDSGQGHPSPRIADLMEGVYDIKVHIVKAMVFPVVMYRCESWTIKKAEHQRIDAFELWCFSEKTLQSPLDSKEIKSVNPKGNQS